MELKSTPNPIDTAGKLKQVATNLFYGWGYNFYRDENKLRADDLLVRGKVSDLLGEARAHLAAIGVAYRREHLPAPTREHPFADAGAVAHARRIDQAAAALEALETRIRNASVPEMDRVHQRHRNERDTLQALVEADTALVGSVASLRDAVAAVNDVASFQPDTLHAAEAQVDAAWSKREAVVSPLAKE